MSSSCLRFLDSLTIDCWEAAFSPAPVDPDASMLATLKTGDAVLMAANATGRTPGLNAISACRWDHVGIVWVHEGRPYVIDSGSIRYFDFCTEPLRFGGPATDAWRKVGSGPQMYCLKDFIAAQGEGPLKGSTGKASPAWYYEIIGVRRLSQPLSPESLGAMRAALEAHRLAPYQRDADGPGEMTRAAVDLCDCLGVTRNATERLTTLFCSELVALLYIEAGLLPPSAHLPSAEYVPSDFARDSGGGNNLSSLCCCCWLSWSLGRVCAGGMRNHSSGEPLFLAEETVLRTPVPPHSVACGRGKVARP